MQSLAAPRFGEMVFGYFLPSPSSSPALSEPGAPWAASISGMQRALVVRGRLKDSRTIVLDEPVAGVEVDVEVVLREVLPTRLDDTAESLIAVVRRADVEGALRGDLEVEVLHAQSLHGNPEDVTESPVLLARRISNTIPAAPPSMDDTGPGGAAR